MIIWDTCTWDGEKSLCLFSFHVSLHSLPFAKKLTRNKSGLKCVRERRTALDVEHDVDKVVSTVQTTHHTTYWPCRKLMSAKCTAHCTTHTATRPLWKHKNHTHTRTLFTHSAFSLLKCARTLKRLQPHSSNYFNAFVLRQGWKWILTQHPGKTASLKHWYHT